MSDEIRPTLSEPRLLPAAGIDEHWCEYAGCQRWGSFGFDRRFGTVWFCRDHREKGEQSR